MRRVVVLFCSPDASSSFLPSISVPNETTLKSEIMLSMPSTRSVLECGEGLRRISCSTCSCTCSCTSSEPLLAASSALLLASSVLACDASSACASSCSSTATHAPNCASERCRFHPSPRMNAISIMLNSSSGIEFTLAIRSFWIRPACSSSQNFALTHTATEIMRRNWSLHSGMCSLSTNRMIAAVAVTTIVDASFMSFTKFMMISSILSRRGR
mmetsp:Transcript_26892/g.63891  ORF Transcript_26892/g.63891 Transcript_26892/m.63891 type:complete len:214 (-) Transcript_26892:389-1030(-)